MVLTGGGKISAQEFKVSWGYTVNFRLAWAIEFKFMSQKYFLKIVK